MANNTEEQKKAEIKLTVIILLSDEGISAGNKLGLTNYEIYCIMMIAMDLFIEVEMYEVCAEIRDYLLTDEMQEIETNFAEYSKAWTKTKKIF